MPPANQVNKDFLKQVFCEEKKLMKKNQAVPIEVPAYEELSVKRMWPMLKKDRDFAMYFPDHFSGDKGPSRDYFFAILNAMYPDYLAQIMNHANEMPWTAKAPAADA